MGIDQCHDLTAGDVAAQRAGVELAHASGADHADADIRHK